MFPQGPSLYNSDRTYNNLVNRAGEPCSDADPCYFLHADMLHEAPLCIGMAHDPETATAYGRCAWRAREHHGPAPTPRRALLF